MKEEPKDYKIIDNFLPTDIFNELQKFMLPQAHNFVPDMEQIYWCYTPGVVHVKDAFKEWEIYYFTHLIYNDDAIMSPLYNNEFVGCIRKSADIKSLMRMKANMFPHTETLLEHDPHFDFPFSHKGGILSINTCDGYTKLEDGTKIDSVANRLLLFDASKLHSSTTTTNQSVRVNINFNYF
jgi:hypothetical protein